MKPKNDVKLRLDQDEIELLDALVSAIKERTSVNTTRAAVAMACFQNGWLVLAESFPLYEADPNKVLNPAI